ncbi:hypothetical protein BESB_023680 [Besnoitia besnoiti]|uniref:Uncharacterized protein n=1 Tax=Besnoitia besnoiti TaxID=94643 RepID=A0A2A9M7K3_BESBE|nr:hypothetical protein BESB_023680 [Besnoitia besnoiti]PFH31876.1 hypothetical protein BESB_023680 [Besnoitia besnoiti]
MESRCCAASVTDIEEGAVDEGEEAGFEEDWDDRREADGDGELEELDADLADGNEADENEHGRRSEWLERENELEAG